MTLNLTQHAATPEQLSAGAVELHPATQQRVRALLTFDSIPSSAEMRERADELAGIAAGAMEIETGVADRGRVMIGGAPFFMAALETALRRHGLTPVYAFSRRESVDECMPDGSIRKTAIFRHLGFVGEQS